MGVRIRSTRFHRNGFVRASCVVDWVSAAPFVQPCHIGQAVVATLEIRVWHDPWLSRPRSFRPITPPPPDLASIRVSDLIDLVSKDWWVERVQELFWPCDSTTILATPLNRVGETDLLVWHYSKDGSFSVRSAYHLALSLEDNPSSSSLAEGEVSWWRKVWQARVPNKVKVFVWRAWVNALPTEMNLKKRIQNLQVVCPFCQAEFEDGLHTLSSCSLLSASDPGTSASFSWCSSPQVVIKINFDGVVFDRAGEIGVGAVARDSRGHCLAWLTHRVPGSGVGEVAVAWVAREAIQLALRHGWRRVVLEGEYVSLIRKLENQQRDLSSIGLLVSNILYFASHFSSCQFSWVRRSGNAVAHFLAQIVSGIEERGSVAPCSVLGLMSLDIGE
ncbi:UNVERIFIED_CONTAM: hypothetical protein Sradi_5831800 [Sesamum radiatum]|uniref:Reverse transcriptase zinc-binding domain-containing protein n=1 Tax=Sesamum radiatum TaxID=300843 RepID=A0AAW2KPC2_SESRA